MPQFTFQSAGYDGYSKSNNARDAEAEGRFPLQKASTILAKKLKWTVAKAKAFLLTIGTKEYHHTSCKYNTTYYYDVSDSAIEDLKDEIASFQHTPEAKKPSSPWFKCWNIDRDVRSWDWKLTNRESSHCYKIEDIKKKLNKMLEDWEPRLKETHATKARVAKETVEKIKAILTEISGEIN